MNDQIKEFIKDSKPWDSVTLEIIVARKGKAIKRVIKAAVYCKGTKLVKLEPRNVYGEISAGQYSEIKVFVQILVDKIEEFENVSGISFEPPVNPGKIEEEFKYQARKDKLKAVLAFMPLAQADALAEDLMQIKQPYNCYELIREKLSYISYRKQTEIMSVLDQVHGWNIINTGALEAMMQQFETQQPPRPAIQENYGSKGA